MLFWGHFGLFWAQKWDFYKVADTQQFFGNKQYPIEVKKKHIRHLLQFVQGQMLYLLDYSRVKVNCFLLTYPGFSLLSLLLYHFYFNFKLFVHTQVQSFSHENNCELQKADIKIVARAIYTSLFFLKHTLSCSAAK